MTDPRPYLVALMLFLPAFVHADEDEIRMETTRIKANRELPQILYMVPWKDFEAPEGKTQTLKLHDFFGELYDPILPSSHSDGVAKKEPRD